MKKSRLMEIIREVINEEIAKIEEAEPGTRRATLGWGAGTAKQQADQMGLEYYGFGRYGKDGKTTHHSVDGKLEPVDKPTTQGPPVKVSTSRPIGTRVADIGPGGKEMNVQTDQPWKDVHSDEGEMEINGKYVSRKKVQAEKPEFYAQYNAARQAAGQDVYWDNGEFKPVYPEPDGSQDAQYAAEDEADNAKIAKLNSEIDKLSSQYTKTRNPEKMKQIKQRIDQLLDAVQKIKNRMAMQAKVRARGGAPY